MSRRWEWSAVALVVAAACIVMLAGLGRAPLQDYDESTYALVTHHMLQSGEYLTPMRAPGSDYFEKPPLYFWTAALSAKLFGESEFALRLPSALAGIGLIAVTIALAYELSESLWAGSLAGAIVLTMAPIAETARQMRVDVPVTFFIAAAAYAWTKAQKNPPWYLLFGFAAGCAFMIKDVIAVFAFAAALLWILWSWDASFLRNKYFWWGTLVFLVVVAPWHLYMTLHFGAAFWREYIGYDVVARSAGDLFAVNITNADYIWYLENFAAPWTQASLFALAALWIWWHRFDARLRRGAAFTASMVVLILAVFFYSKTKAPTYLVPLYPFAAVMLALIIAAILQSKKKIYYCAIALLLAFGTASTIYNAFHFNPYYAQTDELALEEKAIGSSMRGSPQELFAFQTTTLGSIMYYSGDYQPLALGGSVPAKSFIVLPTASQASLNELYPSLPTKVDYRGAQLTLLEVE